MKSDTAPRPAHNTVEVGIYECEIHLKFRLIEEKSVLRDRDKLLELLLEAFTTGEDDYIESLEESVKTHEMSELDASPRMRRQLMRLRNSSDLF